MFHQSRRPALLFLALLFLWGASLYGQSSTGEVNGTVTDPGSATLAGAVVTLINLDTQIVRSTRTNGKGDYTFINLPPGHYSLKFSSSGFRDVSVPDFTIAVDQTFTQAVKLQVGGATETVTVSGESAELLQRSSAELGTVIEERVVHDLPLNGRNFTELLTLTPGVTEVSTAQGSGVGTQDAGISAIPNSAFAKPSLHGQQNRSTLYYLDGVTNTDLRGPVYGVLPMIDAMEQFKVQSHDKAEAGGVVGGVVNIASKSGTNKWHGSAFEFLRNNFFDARDPFKDVSNSGPAPFHQNEFGATLGGPILHDRTFFFASYEGWRYSNPSQNFTTVPTAAELTGDFTNSVNPNLIYNPYSTVPSGTKFVRSRFMCDASGNPIVPNANGTQTGGTACQKVPSQLFSTFMSGLLTKFIRAPNYSYPGSTINYSEDRPNTDNANSYQIKVDHHLSAKSNIWARFTNMYVKDYQSVTGTIEQAPSLYHAYDWGAGYTRLLTSRLVLDGEVGILLKPYVFNSATVPDAIATIQGLGIADAAAWGGLYTQLAAPYFTSSLGSQGDSIRKNPTWTASSNLSWLIGSHNAKIGIMYTNVQRVQQNLSQQFSYGVGPTQYPNTTSTITSVGGNILASSLLGLPSSYSAKLPKYDQDDFSLGMWSGFIEDEWKLSSRLTMTYGLRYDYLTVPKTLDGRISDQLDLFGQQLTIGEASIPDCANVNQNPCFPGAGFAAVPHNDHINFAGFHKSFLAPKSSQFQPRLGLAYQFRPTLVIRAAYGLYWDALPARSQYAQNQLEAAYWPWATGFTGNANTIGGAIQPLSSIEGHFPNPVTSASPWTIGGYYDDPHFKPAYSNQWNLELQQQIGARSMFSIAYVGSSDGNLDYTGNANAARVASPIGTARSAEDQYRAIPWMVSNLHWGSSSGRSNYNALETRFMGQPSLGLRTILSFTWGKSLDDSSGYFAAENGIGGGSAVQNYFDPRSNRSVSSYNIKETVSFATVWDIPTGRGKAHFNHGIGAALMGNWQTNNVLRARTGQPFNLTTNGGDVANIEGSINTLSGYSRPDLAPGVNIYPDHKTVGQWFNPAAFTIPAGHFGNFSRNVMTGGPVWGDDLSMFKKIPFGERFQAQFRFEAFNVFNVQSLSPPGAGSSNEVNIGLTSGVGAISKVALNPRQLQFGIRLLF
jgi:hypothetical protein